MATIKLGKLKEGRLVTRENRFVAQVKLADKVVKAYLPNPGRMEELMVKNYPVLIKYSQKEGRKTNYDLLLVKYNDNWVSLDSHLPNKLVSKALANNEFPEIKDYTEITPEYTYRKSRLDFFLTGKSSKILLEVKSVTLVEGGAAMFPDAPTKRGRRHVNELIKAKEKGYRAVILFLIQREDAEYFTPCDRIDLKFAGRLEEFIKSGGEVYAYDCKVTKKEIKLNDRVPVKI